MPGLHALVDLRRGSLEVLAELRADPGEVVAVLGPNGAGKSTLLLALAGLLPLRAGQIRLGEALWDEPAAGVRLPPQSRGVGLVLADHLLFGHLSALDNVAFGPRSRGVARRTARELARAELDLLGIGDLACRRPATLSSGQAQRVAVARALAAGPLLLLLDEPLSALDPTTRSQVRSDLRARLSRFGGATVMVTHDPLDALSLADRLVFLDHGRVVQAGTPREIVEQPQHPFVAQFVGLNLLRGTRIGTREVEVSGVRLRLAQTVAAAQVWLAVAPHAVRLEDSAPAGTWPARVCEVALAGQSARVVLQPLPPVAPLGRLAVELGPAELAARAVDVGDVVSFSIPPHAVRAYPVNEPPDRT